MVNLFLSFSLHGLVHDNIRVTETFNSLIDNIFLNCPLCLGSTVVHTYLYDHKSITVTMNSEPMYPVIGIEYR